MPRGTSSPLKPVPVETRFGVMKPASGAKSITQATNSRVPLGWSESALQGYTVGGSIRLGGLYGWGVIPSNALGGHELEKVHESARRPAMPDRRSRKQVLSNPSPTPPTLYTEPLRLYLRHGHFILGLRNSLGTHSSRKDPARVYKSFLDTYVTYLSSTGVCQYLELWAP